MISTLLSGVSRVLGGLGGGGGSAAAPQTATATATAGSGNFQPDSSNNVVLLGIVLIAVLLVRKH